MSQDGTVQPIPVPCGIEGAQVLATGTAGLEKHAEAKRDGGPLPTDRCRNATEPASRKVNELQTTITV